MREAGVADFPAPEVDGREVARYAQCPDESRLPLLNEVIAEGLAETAYRVCWQTFPVRFAPDGVDLGFAKTPSRDLARALLGCKKCVVFVATTGAGTDRLVQKYARVSPAKAQLFQAFGAERAEALCDAFCREFGQEIPLRPRFSPGYGDLPLAFQQAIFDALRPDRSIGVTLTGSLMMTPTKSISAIAGF